ncbi:hypothetical protein VPH35_008382 [Triticum aestivum]
MGAPGITTPCRIHEIWPEPPPSATESGSCSPVQLSLLLSGAHHGRPPNGTTASTYIPPVPIGGSGGAPCTDCIQRAVIPTGTCNSTNRSVQLSNHGAAVDHPPFVQFCRWPM